MPGNVVVRPLQANLSRDASNIGPMNPYFIVTLDHVRYKSQICRKGGKTPVWRDTFSAKKVKDEYCIVELRTQNSLFPDKTIGLCQINLNDLPEAKSTKWYDVLYHNRIVGKVLIEASFLRTTSSQAQSFYSTGGFKSAAPSTYSQSLNVLDDRRQNTEPAYSSRYVGSLGDISTKDPVYQLKLSQVTSQASQNYQPGVRTIVPIMPVDQLQASQVSSQAFQNYQPVVRTIVPITPVDQLKVSQVSSQASQNFQPVIRTMPPTPVDNQRHVTFVDQTPNVKKSDLDDSFIEIPSERTQEEIMRRKKFSL